MVKGRSGTSSKLAHVVNAFFVAVIAVSICVLTHTASAHVLPSIVIHPHRDASFTPYDALEPRPAFRDAGLFQDTLLGLHSAASKTSFTLEDRAAVRRELQYLLERFAEEEIRRGSLNKRSPSIDLSSVGRWLDHSQSRPSIIRKRAEENQPAGLRAGFGVLIAVLVILSGMFAGLTLGYFSLDETALAVLAQTGTPKQRRAAEKILPVRKDGHLLLTTLLVANMIFNECLPIIIDQVLPPVPAVALAIVLVIIFAEIIPQSVCSRYGLQIGAAMAPAVRVVMILLWPVAWPVSRVLHWALGPHHGTVYRRAELKELVNMHAATGGHGGDLKGDTVMIIGGALDLQEKVAKQAMTSIEDVFMLPLDARLDYPTLEEVVRSGHSRIPIYIEVDVQLGKSNTGTETPNRRGLLSAFSRKTSSAGTLQHANLTTPSPDGQTTSAFASAGSGSPSGPTDVVKRKKIIGMLLVKQLILLDPEDATPVQDLVINALPEVPFDEPLLTMLNAFQEGRSHMAIVSSRPRRAFAEAASELGSKASLNITAQTSGAPKRQPTILGQIDEEKHLEGTGVTRSSSPNDSPTSTVQDHSSKRSAWLKRLGLQHDQDDADKLETGVKSEKSDPEEKPGVDAAKLQSEESNEIHSEYGMPIGIITLEDLLEELLQEEIFDEHDAEGLGLHRISPPPSPTNAAKALVATAGDPQAAAKAEDRSAIPARKTVLARLGLERRASARRGGADHPNEPMMALQDPQPSPKLDAQKDASDLADDTGSYFEDHTAEQEGDSSANLMSQSGELPPRVDASNSQRRSNSVPPTPTVGSTGSRPTTPGGAGVGSPLTAPQAFKPVIVRAKAADGGPAKMTVINQGLLRGRQGRSGSAAQLNSGDVTPASRSATPASSSRGTRFKSTPVGGPAAQSSNAGLVSRAPGAATAPKSAQTPSESTDSPAPVPPISDTPKSSTQPPSSSFDSPLGGDSSSEAS